MNSHILPVKPLGQDIRDLAKADDKKESGSMGDKMSEIAHKKKSEAVQAPISVINKNRLNAKILEASLKYQGTVANQPQTLFLKAALEGINEALQELGMEITAEESVEEGLEVSPEATADRIVAFSSKYFPIYLEKHPEMNEREALTKYIEVISGGINQGFTEAKEILFGLNVLEGEIASNIEKTYKLVLQGLSDFIEKYSGDETLSSTS